MVNQEIQEFHTLQWALYDRERETSEQYSRVGLHIHIFIKF